MEQRPLRLGNIVDDYCPRERRLTNHVIVAIVDQTIRQTRCTTCDAEHPYKEARIPRRKKPDGARDDAADLAGGQLVVARAASPDTVEPEPAPEAAPVAPMPPPPAAAVLRQPDVPSAVIVAAAPAEEPPASQPEAEAWSGHRRLIRATLPRVEGEQPPARPIPEFTMHQRPQGRGGHGYRHGQPWHGGNGHARNGSRPERDGNVMSPPRPQGGGGGGRRRHRGRHKPR
jgi:hypothetical protein